MKIINPYKYILLIAGLVIIDILGVSYLAVWREWFWSAIQHKNLWLFIRHLSEFSVVVLILVICNSLVSYYINVVSLFLRYSYTKKAFKHINKVEGIGQRIQEDCRDYPLLSITLLTGLFGSIMKTLIYIWIIKYYLSITYFALVILYVVIGTVISRYIASPLYPLNYNNQVTEADFRLKLTKTTFIKVLKNNFQLFKKTKQLNYFQNFYNQISIIFPLLILAPNYFVYGLQFAVLMQLNACIQSLISESSYFINSYDIINKWKSCKTRLKEIDII